MKIAAVDNTQTSFNGFVSADLARVIQEETKNVISQRIKYANRHGNVLQKSELEQIRQIKDLYKNLSEYMSRLQTDTYLTAKPTRSGSYRLTIGNSLLNSSLDLGEGKLPDGSVYSSFLGVSLPELTEKTPNLIQRLKGITYGVKKENRENFVEQLFKMFEALKGIDPKKIDNALFEQSKSTGLLASINEVLARLKDKSSSLSAMGERRDRIRVYNAVNKMFGSPDRIAQRSYMSDLKSTLSAKSDNIRKGFENLRTYIKTARENARNIRNS